MLPIKRKHQKVDITKQKVQYVVDVKMTLNGFPDVTKKAPELITINF